MRDNIYTGGSFDLAALQIEGRYLTLRRNGLNYGGGASPYYIISEIRVFETRDLVLMFRVIIT